MTFHKKAAYLSIVCALPFMFLASWLWIVAQRPSVYSEMTYFFGDAIFQMGFPLTTILYILLLNFLGGKFTKEAEVWVLPLINVFFLLQWITWSQVFCYFSTKTKKYK